MRAEDYQKEMKDKGYNCAQIVFSYFAKDKGLDMDQALKISKAFGGGMMKEDLCGCVTGSYMAMGLYYDDKEDLSKKLREFDDKFQDLAGSDICKEIKERPDNNCGELMVDTIKILDEIIEED